MVIHNCIITILSISQQRFNVSARYNGIGKIMNLCMKSLEQIVPEEFNHCMLLLLFCFVLHCSHIIKIIIKQVSEIQFR